MTSQIINSSRLWVVMALLGAAGLPAMAGDWPQWRYDAGHTAASPDSLPAELHLQWTREYSPREPVWDDPLNRDMMPYDRVFEPVVAQGRMFLSFNDADKVAAFDVRDGGELWSFYADGPVRFPPVVCEDAVLFTSDDGYLYCVSAADGALRWRFLGGPSERKVIGNQRVISSWPARGGPVVADGTVYFAASIWPFMGTFIYALDARTGQVRWCNDATGDQYQKQPHAAPSFGGVAPQGQLAVAGDLLLVPGGRSLPAGFSRASGELRFFNFGAKGEGGSFVAADATRAFVHTRVRGTTALSLPGGTLAKFQVNEPVLAGEVLYAAAGATETKSGKTAPRIQAYDAKNQVRWHVDVDGTGDLIQAGDRLYAAGGGQLTAIELPEGDEPARIAWTQPVEGEVCRLVAAADRLFAVTLDGRVLAFGEPRVESPAVHRVQPQPPDGPLAAEAARLLDTSGKRAGYALWFGLDDSRLLESVAASSQLHIVGVDPDAAKVERLRRQLDRVGWYGRRVALQVGSLDSFQPPRYCAELIVIEPALAGPLRDSARLARVYDSLRPYGGQLWIRTPGLTAGGQAADAGTGGWPIGELAQARRTEVAGAVIVSREGPLPGAGTWTHAYGDVANTVKSNDRRVKLPLGLQWFGGSSNLDVLPRHGHGPSPQVSGGRLFIEGLNCLSARDVYTGRTLWKRELENLDTYQVYYDESYADAPLSTAYNQLHLPGASSRGTNFVATDEGVYLAVRERCLLLDAASGQTLREFVLPPEPDGTSPQWGYIGVYGDLLLAGTGFGDYSQRLGYSYTALPKRGVAWGPDRSGSLGLLAFDRHSGAVAWRVAARYSFLHNGIVAGGGRVYLLDKLPKRVEEQYRRRGTEAPAARLLAIDARDGQPLWSREQNVFGTWLSYSQPHDLLLQAGAAATDRSPDEADRGLAVHRAGDGSVVWSDAELAYAGPCILHGETLITNTNSYRENKGALNLLDGSPVTVSDPVTGEPLPWRFTRAYGCNTAVASEYLLTFRSGAAGFYDLSNHGGTGNFGGFKSGCSSNLIIADGVLNAPDYTRTCTCAYQNQTSLALVPMPENEIWTYGLVGRAGGGQAEVRRIGINLGAPGDRLSDEGTWWVNYPPDEGVSPEVEIQLEGAVRWFRTHSSRIAGDALSWVAASGGEGIRRLSVRLELPRPPAGQTAVALTDSQDDAQESAAGAVDVTGSELELGQAKAAPTIGLRFAKVPLAPGAKIKRAYVQFEVGKAGDKPARLEIRGQAADNAPPFSREAFSISGRPVTQALAVWEPKAWTANDKPGPDQRTVDLSPVVQEIISRPGWQRGNALALIIRGSGPRVATSTDGEQEAATTLVLEADEPPAAAAAAPAAPPLRRFTVRLHFLEPDAACQHGQRVFDVALQGQRVLTGLDVSAAAGGPLRPLIRSFDNIPAVDGRLEVSLTPVGTLPAILSGVEVIEHQAEE